MKKARKNSKQAYKELVKVLNYRFVCGTLPEGYKDISEYYEAGGDLLSLVESAKPGIAMLAAHITDRDELAMNLRSLYTRQQDS